MIMWVVIMWVAIAFLGLSLFYLGTRIPYFFDAATVTSWTKMKTFLISSWTIIGFMGLITLCLDFVNAIICALYFAMIWAVSDFTFFLIQKVFHFNLGHYYAGWVAIFVSILSLSLGWYLNHHVWQKNYTVTTSKDVPNFRIAMFADSHLGTTFHADGLKKHLDMIQAQKPDILVVVGDYVDDGTTREDMIQATRALGKVKTKHGIYFVFGNHDKGYYGSAHRGFSAQELVQELTQNGITVLRDESVLLKNAFYIIGRRDYSEVKEQGGKRASIHDLVESLDRDKFMIVLDHQPVEYNQEAEAKTDLVLSGHTHGGQLFPFNQVGKWIGANDLVYGLEKRDHTHFIVTSGISDWAIQFKTGTKSEFVIIDIKSNKHHKK